MWFKCDTDDPSTSVHILQIGDDSMECIKSTNKMLFWNVDCVCVVSECWGECMVDEMAIEPQGDGIIMCDLEEERSRFTHLKIRSCIHSKIDRVTLIGGITKIVLSDGNEAKQCGDIDS